MSAFMQGIRKLGIRVGFLAAASSALVAIAAVDAGSASAFCLATMRGQGTLAQATVQQNTWSPGFTAAGCGSGTGAEPEYLATGDLDGLERWGFFGAPVKHEWSFIASDDGPSSAQIANARAAAGPGSNVVVVPVAQTAVTIVAHPPIGCTLEKITNVHLEEAFSGAAESWTAIGGAGTTCGEPLTRVVREEGSGTTGQLKQYLSMVNKLRNGGTEAGVCTGRPKWSELTQITPGGLPNTEWPDCGTISPLTAVGGTGVASTVVRTSGTIGYAVLPEAKAKGAATVQVQNNGISGSPIYAAPNNGTEEAKCSAAEYAVPAEGLKATGTGLNVDWSGVFGGQPAIGGTVYPICVLTYVLGWGSYSTAGFGASVGSRVKAYYEYIVANGTGSGSVKKWYANLPTKTGEFEAHNLKQAAEFAVEKIN